MPNFHNNDGTWWAMGAVLAIGVGSVLAKPVGSRDGGVTAAMTAAATLILEEAIRAVIKEGARRHGDACRDPAVVEQAIDRLCTEEGREKAWRVVRALDWSNPVLAVAIRWAPGGKRFSRTQRRVFDRVLDTLCTPRGRRTALDVFLRSCPIS